ncbi:MAG: aldose 1-epimerase, partial [Pseudomonas sp.]
MTTALLHLEDDLTRLTLAPALGGSIVNWTAKNGGHP